MPEDWPCEAYGPEGLAHGARCFFADPGTRNCATPTDCHTSMALERRALFARIHDLAEQGDPIAQLLAEDFTHPDQLLGGGDQPCPAEMLRRALLAATIAEVCHGDPLEVASPTCPMCNEGPVIVLPGWQAACGNDDCPVFFWNPRDTPETFRRQATPVRIQTRRPDGTWEDQP